MLNKLTGRKVYSLTVLSTNTSYVYYQVVNRLIPDDTEYLIYFYLPHHIYLNGASNFWREDQYFEKLLSDNGVIVLDAEKLTGEKFYMPQYKIFEELGYDHPNAETWKVFTPEMVKALNL